MMKNEMCQVIIESTQIAQKVFDTIQNKFESIQTMSESSFQTFCESIQENCASIHCESIQENCE